MGSWTNEFVNWLMNSGAKDSYEKLLADCKANVEKCMKCAQLPDDPIYFKVYVWLQIAIYQDMKGQGEAWLLEEMTGFGYKYSILGLDGKNIKKSERLKK